MSAIIRQDLYRHGGLTEFYGLVEGMRIPGFRYMYFLRYANQYKSTFFIGLMFRFILRRMSRKFGYQIPFSTKIGGGFYIGHFGTIVINHKVEIGRNCNIAHSVTIGMANRGKLKGVPIIGDQVWIGTGVVIVGNINIGSNVLIAPNSYVNIDVPSNSIVMGNPAKIIRNDDPTEGYIMNIYDEKFD